MVPQAIGANWKIDPRDEPMWLLSPLGYPMLPYDYAPKCREGGEDLE
jgi:hypothetical protein